ncbi:hypothetical protein F503_02278 [Ophiostoma piceae UAMH 11346]|uniref:Uncharacterized protein n=1 Tax=Ophiostoma piceae (strain UAMH 11346) TaxID=1262450 RepID=S3BWA1_OPHP1|nr:hypothetical protein F503_02278 [Ophiostoma piceae UAMH 11346]
MSSRSTSPSHKFSKSNDSKNDHLYGKDGQSKSKNKSKSKIKNKSSSSSHAARPPSPMVNRASLTPTGSPKTPRKNRSPSLGSPTPKGFYK